jgi:hypothetical protein
MRKLTNHEKMTLANILDDVLKDNNLLWGTYDAKNGKKHFMYGIVTVMEILFDLIDEDLAYKYTKTFYENMIISEDFVRGIINE